MRSDGVMYKIMTNYSHSYSVHGIDYLMLLLSSAACSVCHIERGHLGMTTTTSTGSRGLAMESLPLPLPSTRLVRVLAYLLIQTALAYQVTWAGS